MAPILLWLRRDLRLHDNPALDWAAKQGRPVIPVWLRDEVVESWGAAPAWRAGLGLRTFDEALRGIGSRLVLRRGPALETLRALVQETGAGTIAFNRLYVRDERRRDEALSEGLARDGVLVERFQGHVLFEPSGVATGAGGFYKVFTPYWNAVRGRELAPPVEAPGALPAPERWPASDKLEDWELGRRMRRGAEVVARHVHVGEAAAQARLERFLRDRADDYVRGRDLLAVDGSSGLSENLTWGEISARRCWFAALERRGDGHAGAETFLKELAWRDFSHHLAWHTPGLLDEHWKPQWNDFPWRGDNPGAEAWRRGCTGIEVVDAAMRELYVRGRMHNRARMLTASYLTKHLLTDWRVGSAWFADCLVDWDPASNAVGWQWAAGCGPDASPFFRIFNPDTQAEKFDPDGAYRDRWLVERGGGKLARSYFDAIPLSWGMSADDPYPKRPVVGLAEGRARALAAFADSRAKAD